MRKSKKDLKWFFAIGKPWYMKWWLWLCTLIIVLAIPFIINELYIFGDSTGRGYFTLWEAKDALAFYGSLLAAIGTIALGIVAIWQNEKANDINQRLLKIEELKAVPFLHIDMPQCVMQSFREHEIDLCIAFRNDTTSIINIVDVSNVNFDLYLLNNKGSIPFCENWTKHYSVLPHQSRQMNFFIENKKTEPPLLDCFTIISKYGFCQLLCNMEIKIRFVNSKDLYVQKYEFSIGIHKSSEDNKYKTIIEDVESTILKEESTNGQA